VGIVTRDFSFQLGQLGRHPFVRGDHLTQSHEGPHYKDAHLDGTGAVEHVCRHNRPVLGEGIGRETGVAVPLGTGRNLRPVLRTIGIRNPANQPLPFRLGQTEYEIQRKSIRVALDLLVQPLGGDPVDSCQVGVEDNLFPAHGLDHGFDGYCISRWSSHRSSIIKGRIMKDETTGTRSPLSNLGPALPLRPEASA